MRIVVGAMGPGRVALVDPSVSSDPFDSVTMREFPGLVQALESSRRPRWIWADTRRWYPRLLAEGVRVDRCHDLVLAAAILDQSTTTAAARGDGVRARPDWLPAGPAEAGQAGVVVPAASAVHSPLFEFDDFDGETNASEPVEPAGPRDVLAVPVDAVLAEHARQLALVAASERPGALRLLIAAESAGALIGAELHAAGLPWHRGVHEAVLATELGPKPAPGRKPARMEELATEVRALLGAPAVNLDSQVDLLKALRRAGIQVESTSRWELREHEHPAIEPLVAYKKLARLLSANAWSWLDEWIVDGRFRPDYVPGGTATGRWATAGGGALQLPKNVRSAVVADPGWSLVVADAAQLEPRVLAGLAHDQAMAEAGRGRDFYSGIVGAGVVETRDQAKVAILGAMYGATTGESGRLVPRLARAYPRAMALVDRAAAEGERGASVTTLLGRSSPLPGVDWRATQSLASQPEATSADERRARSRARDWGRFTRNFVVQGTAAEWALCWMAGLRSKLGAIAGASPVPAVAAHRSGPAFERMPHLVYYLHDEIIVHTPSELADQVAVAVADAATEAGRLLFGEFPVEFPLDLAVVESYASADA
ncbi:3'-5' exonuclease [Agromyces sp. Root81]|uniref:bifunctional 3'-5' exonuclease/DNA polymerase n=1 Tax=Agromyces sp. Root81 TaxID=1736601 RepID=UPI0006F2D7CD|nr:bifunctional 3'-5' exonuclease/DNA polymerase [Agromyces sp. Root81]KRC62554.1 3'-5' exonuclease [Agromyces sp. Root81]